jgi:hypothetical protein
MPETSFSECKKATSGEHFQGISFSNFGLIGCKSIRKCAKSKILNIKVRIKKRATERFLWFYVQHKRC